MNDPSPHGGSPSPAIDRRRFLLLAGLATAGVAAAGIAARSVFSEPEPPEAYLGVHSESLTGGPLISAQQAFMDAEASLDGRLALTRHYFGWNEPPVDDFVRWSASTGRIPVISWHAFTRDGSPHVRWNDIAAGVHDERVHQVAAQIRSLDAAVLFSFHHEPEDDIDAIGAQGRCGENGAEFVAAFDRVQGIFDAEGVDNARRLATLQSSTIRGGQRNPDEWIPTTHEWLGVDGYNRLDRGDNWQSFEELFAPAHARATADGTGSFIQEFGCVEDPADPDAKPAWIRDARAVVKTWPGCGGLLYSHVTGTFNGADYVYRFDTSTASKEAFADLADDAYFGALAPPPAGAEPPA